MDEPESPQADPGLSWWERVFKHQHDQQVAQMAESLRSEQLRAAVDDPFDPDAWQRQRELLGIADKGLDGQIHGALRRLS